MLWVLCLSLIGVALGSAGAGMVIGAVMETQRPPPVRRLGWGVALAVAGYAVLAGIWWRI